MFVALVFISLAATTSGSASVQCGDCGSCDCAPLAKQVGFLQYGVLDKLDDVERACSGHADVVGDDDDDDDDSSSSSSSSSDVPLKTCSVQRTYPLASYERVPVRCGMGIVVTGATSNPGLGWEFALQYANVNCADNPNYIVITGRRTARLDELKSLAETKQGAPGSVLAVPGDLREAAFAEQLVGQSNAFFSQHEVRMQVLFLMPMRSEFSAIGSRWSSIPTARSLVETGIWSKFYLLHYAQETLYKNSLLPNTEVTVFYSNSVGGSSIFGLANLYNGMKAFWNAYMLAFKTLNPTVHITQMFNTGTNTEIFIKQLSGNTFPNYPEPFLGRHCPAIGTPAIYQPPSVSADLYTQAIERFEERTYQSVVDLVMIYATQVTVPFDVSYGAYGLQFTGVVGYETIGELSKLVEQRLNAANAPAYRIRLRKKAARRSTIIERAADTIMSADECSALALLGIEDELEMNNPGVLAAANQASAGFQAFLSNVNETTAGFLQLLASTAIDDNDGLAPLTACPSYMPQGQGSMSVADAANSAMTRGRLLHQ